MNLEKRLPAHLLKKMYTESHGHTSGKRNENLDAQFSSQVHEVLLIGSALAFLLLVGSAGASPLVLQPQIPLIPMAVLFCEKRRTTYAG